MKIPRTVDEVKKDIGELTTAERTIDEVKKAVSDLTDAESLKLMKAARFYFFGRTSQGRSAEDLFQEAIAATLSGARTWRTGISLYQHLLGAMRSIAYCWRSKKVPPLISESDLLYLEEKNALAQMPATSNPEMTLLEKETLKSVQRLLKRDAIAYWLVILLGFGLRGEEIQAKLHISIHQYEAAKKRIKRKLKMFFSNNHPKLKVASDLLPIQATKHEEVISEQD